MLDDIKFPFLSTTYGKRMAILLFLVFIGVLGLDQVSKRHAHDVLRQWDHETNVRMFTSHSYPVFTIGQKRTDKGEKGQFFHFQFQYQRNTGAAFSMLSDVRDSIRVPFFYGVTLMAIFFVAYYLKTVPLNFHMTRLGLVFILSGAIGNFLDRFTLGYVIDLLDAEWNLLGWHHDFAVFNVADVAINLGVICFLIDAVRRKKPLELDFKGNPIPSKA